MSSFCDPQLSRDSRNAGHAAARQHLVWNRWLLVGILGRDGKLDARLCRPQASKSAGERVTLVVMRSRCSVSVNLAFAEGAAIR